MSASDVALLYAWRDGDAVAGEELVGRYFTSIFRFFRGKVPLAADELTQETFLACMEARGRFEEGNSFRSYLFGIARHKLIQHFEHRGRSVKAEALSRMSIADLAPSPSRVAGQDEERTRVLAALQDLPVDHQIAIELVYWEGMRVREVAEVTGVPEGTVKSRLLRARAALAKALAPHLDEDSFDIAAHTRAVADSLDPKPGASGVDVG